MSVDLTIDVAERLSIPFSGIAEEERQRITDIIRTMARDLRAFIVEAWPVDTSASLQEWEVRASGFRFIVRNPIEYAEYVHRAGETVEVWTEIRDQAEALVDAALPEMEEVAAAGLSRQPLDVGQLFGLPLAVSAEPLTDTLFARKASAFGRLGALARDLIRFGIENRIPRAARRARPLGR